MAAYALRRLLLGLITLLLVSFVVYGLTRAMPGDPASLIAASGGMEMTVTAERFAAMQRDFGLDKHWTIAYWEWLLNVLQGDFGRSLHRSASVGEIILEAMGPTLLLSSAALLLAYGLSVPLGLWSAHRYGKLDERLSSAFLYVLYSFPSYVVAVLLLLLVSVKWKILPLSGMRSPDHEDLSTLGKLWDLLAHMVLPVTCYTYGSLAYFTRFIRSSVGEALEQDYIRTARAKGLRESAVLWRHAFRNSLIPFVTLVGLSLPALLGGSVILEQIFAWPGMGRLFLSALETRDYPLILGLTMMFSVLVVAGTLLADLLYALVDPRITYS